MSYKNLFRVIALLVFALSATPMMAAEDHHHHHGAAGPRLALNNGQKWATDEALRQGMANIQKAMGEKLQAIHANKLPRAEYAKLASRLEAEVSGIVSQCHLPEEADAMLHLVLAEIGGGIDAMAGKNRKADPRRGAVRVLGALQDYRRYFDHPGWQPLAE